MSKKFSFEIGWSQLKIKDAQECKDRIMSTLGITTNPGFLARRKGLVEPKASEKEAIERIFSDYGVKKVWGNERKRSINEERDSDS